MTRLGHNSTACALLITLLAACALPALAQQATPRPDDDVVLTPYGSALNDTAFFQPKDKNFGRAAAEVVGINMFIWTYDRYIREGGQNPVFRVGFNSWKENFTAGFNWDDNGFATNQFAHPYHGSLYFNSARSNGYDFWESVPFAFGGSWLWEYMFETHNPSINDWVATSIGGSALGEILHRLGNVVRDNEATGSGRNWREVGGFLVDPVGGLNRIFDGDWGRKHANAPDRLPRNFSSRMDIGLRTRGEERLWIADTTKVFVEFEFNYGDPFFGDMGKPYSNFDFLIQLNFGDKSPIGRVEGNGILAGMFVKETEEVSHILGAYHRYDYIDSYALEFGGQSITVGLDSRYQTAHGLELRTEMHAGPIILGGTSSDYPSISGRTYDYGPGATLRVAARFGRDGWDYLTMSHEQFWIHSISGNEADHHVLITRFRFAAPIKSNLGFGAEYVLMNAERTYEIYPDVSVRNPQGRVFFTWDM